MAMPIGAAFRAKDLQGRNNACLIVSKTPKTDGMIVRFIAYLQKNKFLCLARAESETSCWRTTDLVMQKKRSGRQNKATSTREKTTAAKRLELRKRCLHVLLPWSLCHLSRDDGHATAVCNHVLLRPPSGFFRWP